MSNSSEAARVPEDVTPRASLAPSVGNHGRHLAWFGSQLRLLFGRRRTIAMLLALAAVPVLIAIAVRIQSSTNPGEGPLFLDRITHNGVFVGVTAVVVSLPLFLPLTIGVVAGDSMAGEANAGTLRYLLTVPVGRVRLLVTTYLSTVVFALVATLIMIVSGAIIGAILFPIGPVALLSGDNVGPVAALGRALLVAVYVSLSLLGLAAIGLFISTLTEVPIGAMAATVVLAVAAEIADSIPQLDWLHPWLFTHHWNDFTGLLTSPLDLHAFGPNAALQGAYILVFGALAYARFSTKDITS